MATLIIAVDDLDPFSIDTGRLACDMEEEPPFVPSTSERGAIWEDSLGADAWVSFQ